MLYFKLQSILWNPYQKNFGASKLLLGFTALKCPNSEKQTYAYFFIISWYFFERDSLHLSIGLLKSY